MLTNESSMKKLITI